MRQQLRVEAEREVENILADARVQVRRSRPQRRPRPTRSRTTRGFAERLREEMRLIEERITWAQQGLEEVTARLADPAVDAEGS